MKTITEAEAAQRFGDDTFGNPEICVADWKDRADVYVEKVEELLKKRGLSLNLQGSNPMLGLLDIALQQMGLQIAQIEFNGDCYVWTIE